MNVPINAEKLSACISKSLTDTQQNAVDLADASGLSQQTISALILKRRKSIRPETLLALEETIPIDEDVICQKSNP